MGPCPCPLLEEAGLEGWLSIRATQIRRHVRANQEDAVPEARDSTVRRGWGEMCAVGSAGEKGKGELDGREGCGG